MERRPVSHISRGDKWKDGESFFLAPVCLKIFAGDTMIKRIAQLICFFALMAVLSLSAVAQNVWVRGICKDKASKHIVKGTVEFQNLASGKTITLITGELGEYSTMDLVPGTYKVTLTGPDNKKLFTFDRKTFQPDSQYNVDFDLATLTAKKQTASPAADSQSGKKPPESGNSRPADALFPPSRAWLGQASFAG
jgi:uncharacterized membrane protein